MDKGFFGSLFDFDKDGKLDAFERAAEFMTFEMLMEEDSKTAEDVDAFEDDEDNFQDEDDDDFQDEDYDDFEDEDEDDFEDYDSTDLYDEDF